MPGLVFVTASSCSPVSSLMPSNWMLRITGFSVTRKVTRIPFSVLSRSLATV